MSIVVSIPNAKTINSTFALITVTIALIRPFIRSQELRHESCTPEQTGLQLKARTSRLPSWASFTGFY
jgi:hypothetical protein